MQSIELRCAIAHRRISRFPDAQLRIWGLVPTHHPGMTGLSRLPPRECGMIFERQQDVTVAATAVMERTSDPRLREIMVSLVQHLHGFIRDVRLTEAEFREAAAILAELGKLTADTHNEVILMAG